MKNIPKKIYLQVGHDCEFEDFAEMRRDTEITWNNKKIFEDDIEYRLVGENIKKWSSKHDHETNLDSSN